MALPSQAAKVAARIARADNGAMAIHRERPVIHHHTVQCSLGPVLMAWSAQGLCAVLPGAPTLSQQADLQRRLPAAVLLAATVGATPPWLDAAIAALDGDASQVAAMPLDPQGSGFQLQVWDALRQIPVGQTRSYAQLAQAIGQPAALRAVGAACGANPVAVLIPCHRVLRSDGTLGGYHWGVELKRHLLQREQPA